MPSTRSYIYLATNVASSVGIVFANKFLMLYCQFRFATSLTALHFLLCAAATILVPKISNDSAKATKIPIAVIVIFALTANASIVSLNISLLINPVSLYQLSKMLIVPFCAVLEWLTYGTTISGKKVTAIILVLFGVGAGTMGESNYALNQYPYGLLAAAVSVVSSGLQQYMVRYLQLNYGVSALQLLSITAPVQGAFLFAIGPFFDIKIASAWLFDYSWTNKAFFMVSLSCGLAIIVNFSQFVCLGSFSAVSFQVLGYAKTVIIFTLGWLVLGDATTLTNVLGIMIAMSGLYWYNRLT